MQLLTILLGDRLVTLNALVGLLRRKRVPVRALSVTPGRGAEPARLVAEVDLGPASAQRVALMCRRIVGVLDVRINAMEESLMRETALIRVEPASEHRSELYDTIGLYQGLVLDESDRQVLVEVRGSGEFVLSCLRALERFHISDVVRTEAVIALTPDDVHRPQPETQSR